MPSSYITQVEDENEFSKCLYRYKDIKPCISQKNNQVFTHNILTTDEVNF